MSDFDKKKQKEIILPQLYELIRHTATRRHTYLNIYLLILGAYLAAVIRILTDNGFPIWGVFQQLLGWGAVVIFFITLVFLFISLRHIAFLETFRDNIKSITGESNDGGESNNEDKERKSIFGKVEKFFEKRKIEIREGHLVIFMKFVFMLVLISTTLIIYNGEVLLLPFIIEIILLGISIFSVRYRKLFFRPPKTFLVPRQLLNHSKRSK
ncbi:hypothetical protein ISS37_10550 [candidate division KSB1 bacterium]|nr:hypothetical protein [candidate division KSB1 bacterium]